MAQKSTSRSFNRERWFVLKIPRGDTNGVGEYEVTVTSGLTHKQTEIKMCGSRVRRREDLLASQNKTRGYRCGSTGSRKGLNQRKWKAVRLGCLAAHSEQMDENRS